MTLTPEEKIRRIKRVMDATDTLLNDIFRLDTEGSANKDMQWKGLAMIRGDEIREIRAIVTDNQKD